MSGKLPLIGRDLVLIEKLAKEIRKDVHHNRGDLWELRTRRGFAFEVQITDDNDVPTGRIARVEITLDRVEDSG